MAFRRIGEGSGTALQILLVTSRQTGRWVIPKGNIDSGMAPYTAAAAEAEEEAGVVGEIGRLPLGSFCYLKNLDSGAAVTAKVVVFPLAVQTVLDDWKEKDQRQRRWFKSAEAADAVEEPELREIIRSFG